MQFGPAQFGGKATPASAAAAGPPPWAVDASSDAKTQQAYAQNKKTVDLANSIGKRYDLVLYGDSITAYHRLRPRSWRRHMGSGAVALGVGGHTIEHLTWRIMTSERLAVAPACIALMIGVNNALSQDMFARLRYLVSWLKASYPESRVLLFALLPENKGRGYVQKNAAYKAIARELGVAFAECGQSLDPDDRTLFSDGLHPTDKGYDQLLPCMARAAQSASGAQRVEPQAPL